MMKMLRRVVATVAVAGLVGGFVPAWSAETKEPQKPKPYPLDTCIVSGQKLGAMGQPFVFVHAGRQIKLCCKGCLKAFNQAPAKYIKQLEEAEAKAKK